METPKSQFQSTLLAKEYLSEVAKRMDWTLGQTIETSARIVFDMNPQELLKLRQSHKQEKYNE